jgi:phosphate transport system permease protein
VKAGDRLARFVITLGGIGTIVAVLLVGVFLLAVALPLFRPAAIRLERAMPLPHDPRGPSCLGTDESGAVAWLLDTTGIRVHAVADGTPLLERAAADCGLAGATSIRVLAGGLNAVVGYGDGSLRTGRIGLESTFVAAADLPAELGPLERGSARACGDAVFVHHAGGQYGRLRMVTELPGQPSKGPGGPVIDVDIVPLSGGPLVAALDDEGRVRVETVSSRRNLLTDEIVTVSSGATIEAAGAGKAPETARHVRLSELGDQLFVIAADGTTLRYEIRAIESPRLMETLDIVPGEARVQAVTRLFGGNSLAVADTAGGVRIFFATRGPDVKTADGLRMVPAHDFPPDRRKPGAEGVTAIAASPRSRLFAVADSGGAIRLLQPTTGATVLETVATGPRALAAPASLLVIAPRENRLIAADASGVCGWSFDAGYPEVSLRTLFGRVWYENYPGPVHAWETTGHESFEPKYGLVPLVFGTLKATLYSMLFATPIAVLAAIYSSQFMHPRWRSIVKPTIEMMASLPSVVLGFVAGLIFAPLIETALMPVVAGFFAVPLALLAGAHLWQFLPAGWRGRLAALRLPVIVVAALPAGVAAAWLAAPVVERLLFHGDFRGWLDGRGGSGFGGWVLALLPLAGIAATILTGRFVNPWLRRKSGRWTQRRAAAVSLVQFVVGVAVAVAIAVAAAMFLDALRLDARGGLFGTYVQRNAMIVAIGMSFAIIPLVFTIADDALSSVPDHLRSASLGAGATPWQTAVRVIMPAAASGLFSAVMIGLGRAVGETMIVLMAAGNTPLIGWNLFNGFQTLSAGIATELPEAARGSAHYRVLFLAALTLFTMTFIVNTAAEIVRQRFRRRAHDL